MYLISTITRSTLASLLFKGLATKHTTVKWPIELVGVKSLKAKSGRWPGYVDFIFSLGWKALCFPNVVSYCRCQFDIKRCDLISVSQYINLTHRRQRLTSFLLIFREQKAICERKSEVDPGKSKTEALPYSPRGQYGWLGWGLRFSRCDLIVEEHFFRDKKWILVKTPFSISLPSSKLTISLILFTNMTLSTLRILAVCRTDFICNFETDLAHHRVSVAQWWSFSARNPKIWGSIP